MLMLTIALALCQSPAKTETLQLKQDYDSAEELQSALAETSEFWFVRIVQPGEQELLFYTAWRWPSVKTTSYVVAVRSKGEGRVVIVDYGFYHQTSAGTWLGKVEYDSDRKLLLFMDEYGRALGGRFIDLDAKRQGK